MKIDGTNLSMIRGDSESLIISCTNIDGTPYPLVEGDIVYFTVKQGIKEEVKIIQKVINTFTEGKAIVSILPSDTKSLDFITLLYDVQLNKADGEVTTIVPPSLFTILGEITYE